LKWKEWPLIEYKKKIEPIRTHVPFIAASRETNTFSLPVKKACYENIGLTWKLKEPSSPDCLNPQL
jgi:hypothetical protein